MGRKEFVDKYRVALAIARNKNKDVELFEVRASFGHFTNKDEAVRFKYQLLTLGETIASSLEIRSSWDQ